MPLSSLVKPESLLWGARIAWDAIAMTGTARRESEWCELAPNMRDIAWQIPWANGANVLGAFLVEVTNDLAVAPSVVTDAVLPTVSNNAGPGVARVQIGARFARLVYVNVSGTGTLGEPLAAGKIYTRPTGGGGALWFDDEDNAALIPAGW